MANRPRKLTSKPGEQNQPPARRVKRISKKQRGSWLLSMLAIALLSGSAALIGLFAWISFLFIFNPEQLGSVNKFLPEWAKISLAPGDRPETVVQIQAIISKQGHIAGESLPMDEGTTQAFLLPVFKQRPNCQSDCKELIELRVYQRSDEIEFQSLTEKYYHLATQLSVKGPEEAFVIAPLVEATKENQGSNIELPLTEVKRFEGAPSSGIWYYLRGSRTSGTNAIAYGHVVHYNPQRNSLQLMLSWTSPNGQLPQWQQVTGGNVKELVVNQTVALEPQLRIYQVKSTNSVNAILLEEISLTPPALNNSAYKDALSIAKSGMWTPAFEWLQFILKQRKAKIPDSALAQIDLIRWHSQLTKAQAEKTWASPSQQVLADLIDGRWEKALQVFEASPQNAQEIATFLKADGGRLWSRTEAALQVNPNRPEVQTWGALILAARHGNARANSWLQEQPKISKETLIEIASLLRQLEGEVVIKPNTNATHPSKIVGSASLKERINPSDWLQPNPKTDIKSSPNQWYEVEVSAFHDGKSWLNSPFNNLNPPKTESGKFLWDTLGINSDSNIQIVVWQPNGEQQTTNATIKAVQLRGGVLRLLAATSDVETRKLASIQHPQPLALTNAALEWVQPSAITIEQLYQKDSQRVKTILPTIWRSLQASGQIPTGAIPNLAEMLQKLGYWPVQVLDLTGDQQPETILTISKEALASLNKPLSHPLGGDRNLSRPRSLILSNSGTVIYSDFSRNSEQQLTAIAQTSDGQSLTLLVESADKYILKRWSASRQRFE